MGDRPSSKRQAQTFPEKALLRWPHRVRQSAEEVDRNFKYIGKIGIAGERLWERFTDHSSKAPGRVLIWKTLRNTTQECRLLKDTFWGKIEPILTVVKHFFRTWLTLPVGAVWKFWSLCSAFSVIDQHCRNFKRALLRSSNFCITAFQLSSFTTWSNLHSLSLYYSVVSVVKDDPRLRIYGTIIIYSI